MKYFKILIFGLLFASCDNFLDIPSKTTLSTDVYYQSKEDFEQGLNGVYSILRSLYVKNFQDDANNSVSYHKYADDYSIISNANYLLENIDNVDFDQQAKNNIKGQALFLRAFAYFDLVQYFGKVPLHLTPVKKLSDATQPLASVDSVYDQIIADAKLASELLPDKKVDESVWVQLRCYLATSTSIKENGLMLRRF